ncbi:MAG: thioesterase family protein [Alteripontixanthobacter sp.]
MAKSFSHSFRVRYAEVDPQAVVFNSRYLEYADILVTEWFRKLDIGIAGEDPVEFHVARAVVEYRRPIRADELIEGRLSIARIGNSSMTTRIELYGQGEPGDLRAEIELVQVHVDLASGTSQPLPAAIRSKVKEYLVDG